MRILVRHSMRGTGELTLLKYRRKIDVLPAPADPRTIALRRIGAPLPFLAPYGAAAVPPLIIGTSCKLCWFVSVSPVKKEERKLGESREKRGIFLYVGTSTNSTGL